MCITYSSAASLPDSTEGSMRITADFHYGFVIAHRPVLVPLQQSHVLGFDVQAAFPAYGKNAWEKIYVYPTLGINYSFFNLGDELHLGHGHTFYPFILFPVTRNPRLQLNIRYGVGIGYVDKTFDRLNNYKNQGLATHFNAIFAVHASLFVKLASRTFFQATAGITHFSNGSIDIPNLGINIATLSGGFSYFIGQKKKIDRTPAELKLKKWHGSVMLTGSVKKVYPPGGPRYLAGSLSLLESMRVKKKSAFGIAADLFYDNSIHARLKQDSVDYSGAADQLRMGLAGSYELIVSDLSLLLQVGGYLHTKIKTDGTIYSRFGIRYAIAKNYFVCFNLKTHFAKADFFEWGGGIKF
jgi:hypothetical protein